jgi:hypothetical protein
MFYRILFLFSILLCAFTTLGQSSEALSQMLFPTDVKLQKTIQLIDEHFDFKKKGAFWELTALSNNRKESNKERIRVNPKGKIDEYDVELSLDYAGNFDYYEIETIDIKGAKIPLFGKHGATEQLSAIDNHLSLIYQASDDGFISRILIKELEAIVELTYNNGNLVRFRLTTEDYWGQPKFFIRDYARAQIAKACAKSFTSLTLERRIDVTSYEPTCIAYCDTAEKKKPHYMYGNLVFNGPIKNGLPEGKGWWAIDSPCSGFFDKKLSGSIQYGAFTAGIPTGWHTIDKDSIELEYFFEDGVVTAIKGAPITMPFDAIGYVDTKTVNGRFIDNEAIIRTGDNYETSVSMNDGDIIPNNNPMIYYDKNGSLITLYLNETRKKILKVVRKSPNGKMIVTEFFNEDGTQLTDRTQLEIKKDDLNLPNLKPQAILVEGNLKFDLVNNKWGGENLRISFPENKNLSLTGSFIPAYFYRLSTAPTGKHVFNNLDKSYTATYEKGRFVSGDKIYELQENYTSFPMSINFNRETNPSPLFSYEQEVTITVPPKAYGIAFERPIINKKGCKIEFSFIKANGKEVHWFEKTLDGGEVKSYDFNDAIGPNKKEVFDYKEVTVRRKDCKGEFIQVYLFE